ncbi:aminoglycoside phosphotransferase family protein [Undibacterium sp. Ji22W]|uniref:aminoglycoside phosphotransferase family protein n=1 Tax=Undibacterium sp. Ji22W TaxID=3413038 RepID=UPI003BF0C6C3
MFLTAANLAHYLTARGFVKLSDVVDGQFSVVEAGQHNRNFKVLAGERGGIFVKQIQSLDSLAQSSLLKEAQCYRWAQHFPEWATSMPVLIDYDHTRHSLIFELVRDSQNLREYYSQHENFPAPLAILLADAVARYHRLSFDVKDLDAAIPDLQKKVPWIFTYYKKSYFPPKSLSPGAVQFAELLRSNTRLTSHLDRLFQTWRFETLIHADLKWDNCLIFHDAGRPQLKIIDWELIDFGDRRWDVGSVFQAYLSHWIMRRYRDKTQLREQLLQNTIDSMPAMFSSIHTFWRSYCDAIPLAEQERSAYLLECMEFAAVRMLSTAFESLYGAAEVSQHAHALIELSQQILDEPAQAAVKLFGFSEDSL